MKCILCADTGWVCENHPRRPWEGPHGCDCGGAGMPCPVCNMADEDATANAERLQERRRQKGLAPLALPVRLSSTSAVR
jgi:hypothetical protein